MRTERWRYTEWDDGRKGSELYDYATDPEEEQNLVSDPQHAKSVADLKTLVRKNWTVSWRPPLAAAADKTTNAGQPAAGAGKDGKPGE